MTVPTKAAMKQLLDERMIAGSASNRLPLAMFFLQLNLSGVIILLSLMFYANALGESFVRSGGCFFFSFSSVVWCIVVESVWMCEDWESGWRWSVFGSVWYCFLSTLKIFAFLWTLPVLPWLFPARIRVFLWWRSHSSSHITPVRRGREPALARARLPSPICAP